MAEGKKYNDPISMSDINSYDDLVKYTDGNSFYASDNNGTLLRISACDYNNLETVLFYGVGAGNFNDDSNNIFKSVDDKTLLVALKPSTSSNYMDVIDEVNKLIKPESKELNYDISGFSSTVDDAIYSATCISGTTRQSVFLLTADPGLALGEVYDGSKNVYQGDLSKVTAVFASEGTYTNRELGDAQKIAALGGEVYVVQYNGNVGHGNMATIFLPSTGIGQGTFQLSDNINGCSYTMYKMESSGSLIELNDENKQAALEKIRGKAFNNIKITSDISSTDESSLLSNYISQLKSRLDDGISSAESAVAEFSGIVFRVSNLCKNLNNDVTVSVDQFQNSIKSLNSETNAMFNNGVSTIVNGFQNLTNVLNQKTQFQFGSLINNALDLLQTQDKTLSNLTGSLNDSVESFKSNYTATYNETSVAISTCFEELQKNCFVFSDISVNNFGCISVDDVNAAKESVANSLTAIGTSLENGKSNLGDIKNYLESKFSGNNYWDTVCNSLDSFASLYSLGKTKISDFKSIYDEAMDEVANYISETVNKSNGQLSNLNSSDLENYKSKKCILEAQNRRMESIVNSRHDEERVDNFGKKYLVSVPSWNEYNTLIASIEANRNVIETLTYIIERINGFPAILEAAQNKINEALANIYSSFGTDVADLNVGIPSNYTAPSYEPTYNYCAPNANVDGTPLEEEKVGDTNPNPTPSPSPSPNPTPTPNPTPNPSPSPTPTPSDPEPQVEEPKTEEPKTEEPKTEEPKTEEPKTEEPKIEEPKTEVTKEEKTSNSNLSSSVNTNISSRVNTNSNSGSSNNNSNRNITSSKSNSTSSSNNSSSSTITKNPLVTNDTSVTPLENDVVVVEPTIIEPIEDTPSTITPIEPIIIGDDGTSSTSTTSSSSSALKTVGTLAAAGAAVGAAAFGAYTYMKSKENKEDDENYE